MRIRGAGLIARSAVEALEIVARQSKAKDVEAFVEELTEAARFLLQTRPTAVSLPNGIRYVMHRVNGGKGRAATVEGIRSVAIQATEDFIENAKTAVHRIGEIGARRIRDGDVLLTHCNSSAAIEVMKTAWMQGRKFEVLVTETRPRFQGHITAHELAKAGIPVTLILDDAVRYFMQHVDKVLVGADAITANGALVNKIGTSMVALAAHEARVRVFVAAETYKFSPETMIGELVKIEDRDPAEMISPEQRRQIGSIKVLNPSFDVTPPEFIDLIITERGIIPPVGAILILEEVFGVVTPEELREYQTYSLEEEA
ncbi:translation initiation factor IF-2B subunit delta [archaeon RBG_16_50_20]|nr:MAG: translation initiation factor IF-2B subunit delta [archaeon RBG_16_50_20]